MKTRRSKDMSYPEMYYDIMGVKASEMPEYTYIRNIDNWNYVCLKKNLGFNQVYKVWVKHEYSGNLAYPLVAQFPSNYVEYDSDDEFEYREPSPKKKGRPVKHDKKFSRKPTEYNLFMSEKMKSLKEEYNHLSPSELFQCAATSWKNIH